MKKVLLAIAAILLIASCGNFSSPVKKFITLTDKGMSLVQEIEDLEKKVEQLEKEDKDTDALEKQCEKLIKTSEGLDKELNALVKNNADYELTDADRNALKEWDLLKGLSLLDDTLFSTIDNTKTFGQLMKKLDI